MTKLKKKGMPVNSAEAAQAWREETQSIAFRKRLPADAALQARSAPGPDGPMDDETHDQARTRREIAEANLAELKLQELRRVLVRVADVRAEYSKRIAAARQALQQMPARLVPLIMADPSPAGIETVMRREINAVLTSVITMEA